MMAEPDFKGSSGCNWDNGMRKKKKKQRYAGMMELRFARVISWASTEDAQEMTL